MDSRLGGGPVRESAVRGRGRPHRRRRIGMRVGLGLSSTALIVTGLMGQASPARADIGPTQGSSYAQSLQLTPHEGSLAVGAIMGVAIAGNTGPFARAQSQGVDLGAVGESLQADNCGSPPSQTQYDLVPTPLSTESGETGASQGVTQSPGKSDYFATEYVLANDTPYSEADTTFGGPFTEPGNAVTISGLHSSSWSGMLNGVTGSGASSSVASLTIAGTTVVLNGLQWQAVYPAPGSASQPTGSFTVGQVTISGKSIPVQNLSAVQAAVNAVLGTLGVQLQLPQVTNEQGTLSVTPLELDVVPNATRDATVDAALDAAQPDYYQIANGLENGFSSDNPPLSSLGSAEQSSTGQQLAAALCQSDTPVTVADVTMAAFDGGGYFSASLGGVNASSSPVPVNNFNLAALGLGTLTLPSQTEYIPGTAGTPAIPPSPSTLASVAAPTTTPTTQPPAAATPQPAVRESIGARPVGDVSGGPLLAAGLGGLGLLLLLIEGDRRMMRRSQRRSAPLEE